MAASTVAFLPSTIKACDDHVRVFIGYHACKTAHLVILDTMDRLHQVVPVNETWVMALLYIVGLGKPVTTLDAWIKLRGDVRSPDARRVVINHKAGNKSRTQTVEFHIAGEFEGRFPEVASALRACVDGEGSAWKIVARFTRNPGKKVAQVRVDSYVIVGMAPDEQARRERPWQGQSLVRRGTALRIRSSAAGGAGNL